MKTQKLQRLVIEHQLEEIKRIDGVIKTLDSPWNRALKESYDERNKNRELESQNKSLQSENDALKGDYETLMRTCKSLQSALSKFEDLKKDLEGANGDGVTVWIAMDKPFNSDEKYGYIYNQQPVLRLSEGTFETQNLQYGELNDLELPVNLQPLQCKKFRLIEVSEVQDENQN